jgi:hypothetical protein
MGNRKISHADAICCTHAGPKQRSLFALQMIDYHPLLLQAIATLADNDDAARRVLYERARAALLTEFRAVKPPLNESEITRERLALEEGIRRIEAEYRRRRPDTMRL